MNFFLYTPAVGPFDPSTVERLAVEGAEIHASSDGGLLIRWGEAQLLIFPPLAEEERLPHLEGLMELIAESGAEPSGLVEFLRSVRLAIPVTVKGPAERVEPLSLVISLACSYENCLISGDDGLYLPMGAVIFGPPGSPPLTDLGKLQVRKLSQAPKKTEAQEERTRRVQALLNERGVPIFRGPLPWIPDDSQVGLRDPLEVARRVLAMHGAVCLARGRPREDVLADLEPVQEALSPAEREFIYGENLSSGKGQDLIWRLEALKVLMWTLGHGELPWPEQMCDADEIHRLIFGADVRQPRQIEVARILDALELTVRIHWAVRECLLGGQPIPDKLDWRLPGRSKESPLAGVVEERHYALNWLIRFREAEWDEVDTPT